MEALQFIFYNRVENLFWWGSQYLNTFIFDCWRSKFRGNFIKQPYISKSNKWRNLNKYVNITYMIPQPGDDLSICFFPAKSKTLFFLFYMQTCNPPILPPFSALLEGKLFLSIIKFLSWIILLSSIFTNRLYYWRLETKINCVCLLLTCNTYVC